MGKTTLWRAGVELGEETGMLVLEALPVDTEATLAFAGIGDLLAPVVDRVLELLPAVQRRALSRALALGDDDARALDPLALRVALLRALRLLAEEQEVLVAIDDSQSLDHASSAVLAYGIRRLQNERVGVFLSRRSGVESVLVDELRQSALAERLTTVHVGALDIATLGSVVNDHLGESLPRPLLGEVHQASGGNPFYALEIVRMLKRSDFAIKAGQPLPVPESLHELVRGRLSTLPPDARAFLLTAAACAHSTVSVTEAASGIPRAAGLAPSLEAHVVELDGERIRFTHPLLAAGAYEIAEPLERREVHARLAQVLEDPEARAWQLAASVEPPDGATAAVLESAAEHARLRGAPRLAALLLDRASELTPVDRADDAARRRTEAAYLHFESGDSTRAAAKLQALIAQLADGEAQANALWVLARIRTYEAPLEAAELFLRVLQQAGTNRRILTAAHEGVASCFYYALERLDLSEEHARAALALAKELGDEAVWGDILICKLGAEALRGHPEASATAEEALELQRTLSGGRIMDQPLLAVAEYQVWTDRAKAGTEMFHELLHKAEDIGDESCVPYISFFLGIAECLLGELDTALEHARQGCDAAERSGQLLFNAYNLALRSLAHAQLGDAAEARDCAARAADAVVGRVQFVDLITSSAIGHLEHSLADSERVIARLEPPLDVVRREGVVEPTLTRFVVDLVEALTELGRTGYALELLDWYEANAHQLGRASALANSARCRGLLAAQEGDLDGALAAYAEALEWHARVDLPLDRGRTLLALGAAQRRAKRRREARATLELALAIFQRIGAAIWAERSRAELRRISGRAPAPHALTPAEVRVAALVAEGRTNREVAAALFLSERTVEGHLSHIFGKLQISHRSELAGALSRQTQGIAASNTGDSPVSRTPSPP